MESPLSSCSPMMVSNNSASSFATNPSSSDEELGTSKASPVVPASNPVPIQAKRKRRKKKRLAESLSVTRFRDVYYLTGDVLGEGAYGCVQTCINMYTDNEYAVKIISKDNYAFSRAKVLKEVELYYLCQGQKEIIQLIEYFEEPENFYLIFEKAYGGQLLDQIQSRIHFTESEAVAIIRDLALALRFLHERGIAHRDIKPENILCLNTNSPWPIKLCDFDLCSGVHQTISTPLLQSPVGSAEYMAPEVVNAFSFNDTFDDDDDEELTYDKRCDLWSLGIIAYILLCGYLPFSAGGQCEDQCGWESGEECLKCQKSLFENIKSGTLVFPDNPWASISSEAKDLISRLLVKEASLRLDAESLLKHPWITKGGSTDNSLETPSVLRRQTSVKEFSELATNAITIKRELETNHSFSRAFTSGGSYSLSVNKSCGRKYSEMGPQSGAPPHPQVLRMRRQTSMILPEETASGLFNHLQIDNNINNKPFGTCNNSGSGGNSEKEQSQKESKKSIFVL